MKSDALSRLGLTKNESKTYIALLEIGPASILEIARKTGVNRSMLYEIIDDLIKRGVVYKTVRGKKTKYVGQPVEFLRKMLLDKLDYFDSISSSLLALAEQSQVKPVIKIYEGLAGIKEVYRGAIHSKEKKLYAFVGVESLLSRSLDLQSFWDGELKRERQKRNVYGQLLIPNNTAGRAFQKKDNRNFRESRFVDAEKYNFPVEIMVYDDVVAIISFSKYEELGLSIKSIPIANAVKMLWNFVWLASG